MTWFGTPPVDLLGRASQTLDLEVGLEYQEDELLLGHVDCGDAGVVGVDVIAQDLPAVLEALLRSPLGLLPRPADICLRSN